jgi:hypothetical protein
MIRNGLRWSEEHGGRLRSTEKSTERAKTKNRVKTLAKRVKSSEFGHKTSEMAQRYCWSAAKFEERVRSTGEMI